MPKVAVYLQANDEANDEGGKWHSIPHSQNNLYVSVRFSTQGVSEQCFSPRQHSIGYMGHGRRFLQVKRHNQQYQSTEGDATKEKENNSVPLVATYQTVRQTLISSWQDKSQINEERSSSWFPVHLLSLKISSVVSAECSDQEERLQFAYLL